MSSQTGDSDGDGDGDASSTDDTEGDSDVVGDGLSFFEKVDRETECKECGLPLEDAYDQPAGYVTFTLDDDGEFDGALCGACTDIQRDYYRGRRQTADEIESDED